MRAVDTNVVVRLLAGDGGDQADAARRIIAAGDVFVAVTVILETEWVLRTNYRFPPTRVVMALRDLARLPDIAIEHPRRVAIALDWAEAGLDFADALHLAAAQDCTDFVTFDQALARRAAAVGALPVVAP